MESNFSLDGDYVYVDIVYPGHDGLMMDVCVHGGRAFIRVERERTGSSFVRRADVGNFARKSWGRSNGQRFREHLTGERSARGDVFRRPLRHDLASFVAGARAQVDDPVGGDHELGAVLDDDHRVAAIDEGIQGLEQLDDVERMEPGGRLVEQEERVRGGARRV